jgi:hypothetical protein
VPAFFSLFCRVSVTNIGPFPSTAAVGTTSV